MSAYKGCPTITHKNFLKDSLLFIEKYKPKYVVQKIFLSDKNEDFNNLLLDLCYKYNNKEIYRPASASLGTTEAYLIMSEYVGVSEYAEFKDVIVKNLSQAYKELSEDRLINSNILNENIKNIYISKKKEKENIGLENLEDRQKYRVAEVQRYWQCEMKHIESYSKTMWFNMGIHHNIPNSSNIKAYKDSDAAAILKLHTPGVYITKQFGGRTMSVACGEYEVAYDGIRFVPLKLVYNKKFLTDCDYYYTADCVAPFLLVNDALRLFQADRKLKAVDFSKFRPYKAEICLVEGVPGSGKTYEIVHSVRNEQIVFT
jgi:hypothetical protein